MYLIEVKSLAGSVVHVRRLEGERRIAFELDRVKSTTEKTHGNKYSLDVYVNSINVQIDHFKNLVFLLININV